MTKELTIKLSDHAYQHIEALAYGLAMETGEKGTHNGRVKIDLDKTQAPGDYTSEVVQLLTQLCSGISTAVERPGSWENGSVASLTGWQGSLIPAMFGELVEVEQLERINGELLLRRTTKNGPKHF